MMMKIKAQLAEAILGGVLSIAPDCGMDAEGVQNLLEYPPDPPGITIEVPSPNKIIIRGIDKQVVGQFAAEVRGKRPPEPYKGKGIKYVDEVIRRKVGKTGGKK